jgi:hypothetical protein
MRSSGMPLRYRGEEDGIRSGLHVLRATNYLQLKLAQAGFEVFCRKGKCGNQDGAVNMLGRGGDNLVCLSNIGVNVLGEVGIKLIGVAAYQNIPHSLLCLI